MSRVRKQKHQTPKLCTRPLSARLTQASELCHQLSLFVATGQSWGSMTYFFRKILNFFIPDQITWDEIDRQRMIDRGLDPDDAGDAQSVVRGSALKPAPRASINVSVQTLP